MANLTADYSSQITNQRSLLSYLVAAGQTFFLGGLIQADNSGNAIPLNAGSTNKVLGQLQRVSPDATQVEVREGDLSLENDATNPVAQANVGAKVYASDDHTVSTLNSLPVLGILIGFSASTGKPIVRVTLECAR